jgi:hypothetical protein
MGSELPAKNRQRLGGDHGEQPTSIDADAQRGFAPLDGQGGENRVVQQRP